MVHIEIYKRRGQTLCRPWEGEYFIPWGMAHLPVGTCCLSNRSWESCQDSLVSHPGSWDMKSTKEKCTTSMSQLSIPFPPHFSSDLLAPVCGPARSHCPLYIYSYLTFKPRSKTTNSKSTVCGNIHLVRGDYTELYCVQVLSVSWEHSLRHWPAVISFNLTNV